MKHLASLLATTLLLLNSTVIAPAQYGGQGMSSPPGPDLSGELLKLFDKHKGFSASMELKLLEESSGNSVRMPGKLAFSDGTTRFEMDLTEAEGDQIPAGAAEQLEQIGMSKMVMISEHKSDKSIIIYPGLKAYVNLPVPPQAAEASAEDYTMEVTELAKEEMSGQACVKNKVIITGKDGQSQEATVWTATELKDFPVRIETSEEGNHVSMQFTDIELSQPAAELFQPPATYKKYENMMGLMQEIMMKRMGGAAGAPPAR
jgi:hypothetical protein